MMAAEEAEWYQQHEAEKWRNEGVNVKTQSFIRSDAASASDEAVRIFKSDMIAIATNGAESRGHGPVPVLLRHLGDEATVPDVGAGGLRIMVPLDGSANAEKALPIPVAQELALEWNAPVSLVRVILDIPVVGVVGGGVLQLCEAYIGIAALSMS